MSLEYPNFRKAPERNFDQLSHQIGTFSEDRSKEGFNFVPPDNWDDSSEKADWRNLHDPTQPFFHTESHARSHEGSLHFDHVTFENEKTIHDPAAVNLPPFTRKSSRGE